MEMEKNTLNKSVEERTASDAARPDIPISDVESKEIAQNELQTTISPMTYERTESDLNIIKDTVDNNYINEPCSKKDAIICDQEITATEYNELNSEQETLINKNEVNIEANVIEKDVIKSEPLDFNEERMAKSLELVGNADYTEDDVDCNKIDVKSENSEVEERWEVSNIDIKEEVISQNTSIWLRDKIILEADFEMSTKIINENEDFTIHNANKFSGDIGLLMCNICNISYRRNHAPKFSCTHCNYKACNKSALDGHINEIHIKLRKCIFPTCKFETCDESNLKNHINSQHTILLSRTSHLCAKSYYKTHKRKSKNHLNSKHTSLALKDEYDKNRKSDKIETEKDDRAVTNTIKTYCGRGLFICDICNTRFRYKSTLIPHIQAHAPNLSCAHCDYKTSNEAHLKAHINAKHTKIIAYKCSFCVYKAYDKNTLDGHMSEIHLNGRKCNFPTCEFKTYFINSKRIFLRHIYSQHTPRIEVEERSEGLTIDKKEENLIQHTLPALRDNIIFEEKTNMESDKIETENDKFIYDHCSKSTLKSDIKAKHKTYNCSYCEFRTKKSRGLELHVNAIHLKNNLFCCPHCSYSTYYKSSLNTHVKSKHIRDKAFSCSICSFQSFYRTTVKYHIKVKHKCSREECPILTVTCKDDKSLVT